MKVFTIEVPEWVSEEEIKEFRKILVKFLVESMKNVVDPRVYRLYLALMYPETGFTELEDEERKLREMREEEKNRVNAV